MILEPNRVYIHHMQNLRTTLTATLLLVGSLTAHAADNLWNKAIIHARPENTNRADTVTMSQYERNRDGEIISEVIKRYIRDESSGEYLLIAAVEDGKDITEKERRKEERQDDEEDEIFLHQMFNPEKAEGLTITPREATAIIGGRECRIYDYRFEDEWKMGGGDPKPVVEEGTLFLDVENGMPLRINSSLTENPGIIKSFTYLLEAVSGPDGIWRPMVMETEFSGKMIIRKAGGFRMEFFYSD